MSSSEKEAFLKGLKDDPYNQELRLVFSDWLEENGFDDEALEQRSWTKEKQESIDWLTDYAQEVSYKSYTDEDTGEEYGYRSRINGYEDLIEAANAYLDNSSNYVTLPFNTPDIVYDQAEEFWVHFQRATGRTVNHDHPRNDTFIGCAC